MKQNSEYLKKFNRCILEYTNLADSLVSEDGPDPMAAGGAAPGMDPMAAGGAAPGMDPMAAGGAAPGMDQMAAGGAAPGMDPMAAGGAAPMVPGGVPGMVPGAMPNGGVEQEPPIDPAAESAKDNAAGGPITPQVQADGGDDAEVGDSGEENTENEEIKNAQNDAMEKIEKLSAKFEKVFSKIDDIDRELSATSEKLDSLRSDIEKRNPSDEEKLSIRSLKSGPFNETPEEYWEKKESDPNSNYSAEDDNNGEDMGKYKITKDEVNNISDWSNISKSFDDERFGLKGLLGY